MKTTTEKLKRKSNMITAVIAQVVSSPSLRHLLTSTTGSSSFLTTFIVIIQLNLILLIWKLLLSKQRTERL